MLWTRSLDLACGSVLTSAMRALVLMLVVGSGCASFPRMTSPPLAPPAGATFVDGAGGVRLFTAIEGEGTRGVVWFVLGPEISSTAPYPQLSAALREAGFATAVLHPRGTGYSDGLRGHVDDYGSFLGDYRQFFDALAARFAGRALFLFGHSAGAAFALELAAHAARPLAGVVLVNPAYKLVYSKGMGPSLGDYFVFGANWLFRPSALTVDMNSNPAAVENADDRAEAEAMQRDPLVVRYFSLRMLAAQREVMNRCVENARGTKAPLLLVSGAHDALVDPRGNDEILSAAGATDRQRLVAPNGGHGSSSVETEVATIVEWLSRHAR